MRILLDTHIALWAIADTGKLSKEVFQLPMSEEEFVELCAATGFVLLPIETKHIFMVKTLKRSADAPKHNGLFDRILLSQAKCENMTLLTHDSLIPYYGEECVKCV